MEGVRKIVLEPDREPEPQPERGATEDAALRDEAAESAAAEAGPLAPDVLSETGAAAGADVEAEIPAAQSDDTAEGDLEGEGWSGSDIEEAYLKALQAMEDLPWSATQDDTSPAAAEAGDAGAPAPGATDGAGGEVASETLVNTDSERPESGCAPGATSSAAETGSTEPGTTGGTVPKEAAGRGKTDRTGAAARGSAARGAGPRLAASAGGSAADGPQLSPRQVIEAALFVGGGALNSKRLCGLLGGSFQPAAVDELIDELNREYLSEERPYEIRLGDGGWRMELRPEFDRLRARVYGVGPREVKLSQEVLEVLALVAYKQPISPQEIEGFGKQNAGGALRQLLRRELIAIERGSGGRQDIRYHTTPRFLSLFGLGSLDELPQAEDVETK